jgi:hypothetical protein
MSGLRSRLEQLETSLAELEKEGVAEGVPHPVKASAETTIIRPNGRQEKS